MKHGRLCFSPDGKRGCSPEAPNGIFYGILYSLPLWAVIAFAAWMVRR
jgi:hypothetical protein